MKTFNTRPPGLFGRLGALVLSALALVWLPHAEASVSAGATIANIAVVNWEDSSANSYSAFAHTEVTVTTLDNPLTISGAPT